MRVITDLELEKLEGFVGYGKPNAEIIFIGLEEGGGGDGFENLMGRLKLEDKYVDKKRFHLDLLFEYKFHNDQSSNDIKLQQVWRYMSYLMLRLEGKTQSELLNEKNRISLRAYQNNMLGTNKGNTLLTEIYPIPCKGLNFWGISNKDEFLQIIPQYNSKTDYKNTVFPKRQKIIKEILDNPNFSAKAIICYGKTHWGEFKELFNGVNFKEMEEITEQKCEIGLLNNRTKIILTPFFGGRFNKMSYNILDKLCEVIKSESQ